MNNARKEIAFLIFLLLFSIVLLQRPGFYNGISSAVSLHNYKIKSSRDIHYEDRYVSSEKDIVFNSGYPESNAENHIHSDFYEGNINLIRTSDYWIYPILNKASKLVLIQTSHGYESALTLLKRNELPVVSLVADPNDLFSFDKGIYVKGRKAFFQSSKLFYPMPWHKPANYNKSDKDDIKVFFTYYNKEGKSVYNSYVKAEISGNATRCFPQKSIKVSSDKSFGKKEFSDQLFTDQIAYSSLVLRNGGNDNTKALCRDMLMQSLMRETGLLTASFTFCEMYLNGEYWGLHTLQNRLDADFIAKRFKVKKKNITLIEDWKFDKGSEKEFQKLMRVLSATKNKIQYNTIFELLDEEDFINYLIGEIYFANTDWPENNLRMYKISGKKNEKWKFAFFDLDYGMGYTSVDAVHSDMFKHLLDKDDLFSRLFKLSMKNKSFRQKFKKQFEIILNSFLTTENIEKKLNKIRKEIDPVISAHTMRWQKPTNKEQWENYVNQLSDFAKKRNEIIKNQIQTYLN